MATAKKGIDQILLFRKLGDTKEAAKLLFQTEHAIERSIDGGDSTATKDGPFTSPGTPTQEIPFSSLVAREDTVAALLKDAFWKQEVLEVWTIDKGAEAVESKYPATYCRGKLTEFNETANAEDLVELEGTIVVDGVPQDGEATLSAQQAEVVQYVFTDTVENAGV